MRLFLLLLALTLCLPALANAQPAQRSAATDSFRVFRSAFSPLELPYEFSEEARKREGHLNSLADEQLSFIPAADPLWGNHFAVGTLAENERFIALLYKQEGAAGGYSDSYYLLTYMPSGELIAEQRVAYFGAAAAFTASTEAQITPELAIAGENKRVERTMSGDVTSRKAEPFAYQVTESGEIEER